MSTKNRLHQLVDELPESEVPAAERFLEYLRDRGLEPLVRALLSAPEDDEPETPEEAAAVQIAREQVDRGETVPWEDVKRRLVGDP